MNRQPAMNKVRELANQFIQQGNPTGWFEPLYSQAKGDTSQIPWADLIVNPNLSEWLEKNQIEDFAFNTLDSKLVRKY